MQTELTGEATTSTLNIVGCPDSHAVIWPEQIKLHNQPTHDNKCANVCSPAVTTITKQTLQHKQQQIKAIFEKEQMDM